MKILGIGVIFSSILLVLFSLLDADHLFLPPTKRLNKIWETDIQTNILQNKEYKKLFSRVSKYEFTSDDPDLAKFLDTLNPPASANTIGDLKLNIHISRWFEGKRYGFVIQHNFLESHTQEKVFEFGRTYTVGYIW